MKYRVAIITQTNKILGKNFNTRDKAETWIIEIMETEGVKHYKIIDRKTKEVLETDKKTYKRG